MQYLAKQFDRFGSWELAIASYNCGPGTIDKAMKRGRSDNYWTISKYLPRETRNFVPAFLGAVYVGNFYHLHDIEPEYPSLDMQVTEAVTVFEKIDFKTIASLTGLPIEIIGELNPAYKKDYIPENIEGYDVILPRRVATALIEYLEARKPDNPRKDDIPALPAMMDSASYKPDEQYFRSVYVVAEGDKIGDLAEVFNIAPYNLKVWNKLTTYQLNKGQELDIWFPNEYHHFLPKELRIDVEPTVGATKIKMVQQVQEEAIVRENVPVPAEMPIKLTLVKEPKSNITTLQVMPTAPTIVAYKPTIGEKVGKFMAPIKNAKITLPKVKMPKVTLPKLKNNTAPSAPKKAPVMPKETTEPSGHGLI